MKRIYLDYAASTPVHPQVLREMEPYFSEKFGNSGSLHSFGQEAMAAVDLSREKIARAISANFSEVIFTGSATESNNIALRGIAQRCVRNCAEIFRKGQREISDIPRLRMVVSSIEHESVLETARDLERDGVEVIYLPVNGRGIVSLEKLKESLNENTILVSVMYANNEIGSIQPISEIAKIISDFRKQVNEGQMVKSGLPSAFSRLPLFHTDAAQAFQFLDCGVNNLGVDLMTLSAQKIYGPKGVGALYVRGLEPKNHNLKPIITGGGQEFGFRSGTENVPSIVGFAKAVELILKDKEKHTKRIASLRDYFWRELKKIFPKAEVNGAETQIASCKSPEARSENRLPSAFGYLPSILNVYFPGRKSQFLLTKLDLAGVAVSAGSACRARAIEPSYVIQALGLSRERASSSLRFSFGRPTTKLEVDRALQIIKKLLSKNS